jgi:hypothetical protein
VILPADADIRVKKGQRVKGGASIIAEMPESETMAGVREPKRAMRASVKPDTTDGEGA